MVSAVPCQSLLEVELTLNSGSGNERAIEEEGHIQQWFKQEHVLSWSESLLTVELLLNSGNEKAIDEEGHPAMVQARAHPRLP